MIRNQGRKDENKHWFELSIYYFSIYFIFIFYIILKVCFLKNTNSNKIKMDSAVDWTPVDLLISQLMEVYDPHEDAETIQESLSTLNSERDVFRHAEETLRGLAKGLLCIHLIITRFTK